MSEEREYDSDKSTNEYLKRLAKIELGISVEKREKIRLEFLKVSKFYAKIDLEPGANREDIALLYLVTDGDAELADLIMGQYMDLERNVPDKYDFNKIFSKRNGWPNLSLKPHETLKNDGLG